MSEGKYLRELGVHKLVIIELKKATTKKDNKPQLVVVLERPSDGARIDAKFMLPMVDWAKKSFFSLVESAIGPGNASGKQLPVLAAELKGKTIAVLVAPSEGQGGKQWWNTSKYWPVKHLEDPQGLGDLGGGLDDLGFGDAPGAGALTQDPDTIPF